MTVLDTQIWVWWVNNPALMPKPLQGYLEVNEKHGFGVSAISCLEVARLAVAGRLTLPIDVEQWVHTALRYPGVSLIDLSPASLSRPPVCPSHFTETRVTASSWPLRFSWMRN